jgi:hypothetical protein
VAAIRQHLGVTPYGPDARHAMVRALAETASTKHELEDLINVAIEQLGRQRFELLAFDMVNRAARASWAATRSPIVVSLVRWGTYRERVADYAVAAGVPVDALAFVEQVQNWLDGVATTSDEGFPEKQARAHRKRRADHHPPLCSTESAGVRDLESRLAEHMPEQHLLNMLADTEHWLHWTNPFGPISGHETKLEDAVVRYLATVFCYGTNMGPRQAARSLIGLDRRQIEWINQHHVVEEGLDEASTIVVNGYHRFLLTRAWGSGKHVSADGTQWETYERNLLAERHIRYSGFGGIAYYNISDLYIALFSRFIPCCA